jgi:hypothetical protein
MPEESVPVEVIVSIDDDHGSMSEVVERLESAGMQVDQSLERLGAVTGQIASSRVEALSQIQGVKHIERSRGVQLPPPDADVQ